MFFQKLCGEEFLATIAKSNGSTRGIVSDIDDTLCDTWIDWIRMTFTTLGNPEGLSPEKFREQYGKIYLAPYFRDHPELWDWIQRLRYSSDAHSEARPIDGAREALHLISGCGAVSSGTRLLGYLTARVETLYQTTKDWLICHGFPDAPIIMPPRDIAYPRAIKWKASILHQGYPAVRGIIDDDPLLVEELELIGAYKGLVWLFNHETGSYPFAIPYPCHMRAGELILPRICGD